MSGFLDAYRGSDGPQHHWRSASLPAPLDARNGRELTGAEGSHPLAFIDPSTLLHPTTEGLEGTFIPDADAHVGGEIRGRLQLRALRAIDGRRAALVLRGYLLRERERSVTQGSGEHRTTERWVEVEAEELETIELLDTPLPATLAAGATLNLPILAPAPRLGPPSLHAGPVAVVWLLVAAWDIALGGDERFAALIPVAQHRDLVTAGVLDLGGSALLDVSISDGASFALRPAPPIVAGSDLRVAVAWSQASGGRGARVELHADLAGYDSVRFASVEAPTEALASGLEVVLPIPADAPAVFDARGITLRYRLRALVDRPLLPDLAVERGVAILGTASPEL
jgi:hypothetical protein